MSRLMKKLVGGRQGWRARVWDVSSSSITSKNGVENMLTCIPEVTNVLLGRRWRRKW
jgi:hypothetical protein